MKHTKINTISRHRISISRYTQRMFPIKGLNTHMEESNRLFLKGNGGFLSIATIYRQDVALGRYPFLSLSPKPNRSGGVVHVIPPKSESNLERGRPIPPYT